MLREKRISVIMNANITRFEGSSKLEKVHFSQDSSSKSDYDLFITPDLIIGENGIGNPKVNLQQIVSDGSETEDE
jgi:hypothetical protein